MAEIDGWYIYMCVCVCVCVGLYINSHIYIESSFLITNSLYLKLYVDICYIFSLIHFFNKFFHIYKSKLSSYIISVQTQEDMKCLTEKHTYIYLCLGFLNKTK